MLNLLAVVEHGRVVIEALPGKDMPIIEASWIGYQMPLTDNRGLVTHLLQKFGEGLLATIESPTVVIKETIEMAVLACQNHSSAWTTNRIGN